MVLPVPELPDIVVYVEALERRIVGTKLLAVKLRSVSLLRTVMPPYRTVEGHTVQAVRRMAKRIVVELDGGLFMVFHLMRLGRFRWADTGEKAKNVAGKVLHGGFEFERGTLYLTEMGTKKRASLHVLDDAAAVADLDRGGLEVLDTDLAGFAAALRSENRTLKRALTDPRLLSGIGNAYSDEILHAARMSPVKLTQKLSDEEVEQLYVATKDTLKKWTDVLRDETGDGFPEHVTAFREGMAVHGKYRKPCPVCGKEVQRIAYADRETNYCAQCQTGGRPLADRALSRLLGKDWPKTLEELEERRGGGT
jgi:formamidopyrimidine-DNA glycosylase